MVNIITKSRALVNGTTALAVSVPRLKERRKSWYIKQVAHTFEGVRCDRLGRFLGLVVVIVTAVIGTSVFAALNNDPSLAAKIAVGTLSVLAAVLAAWKENAGYGRRTGDHVAAAAVYEHLRYEAQRLADQMNEGTINLTDAETALTKLETTAEAQDAKTVVIPQRMYDRAHRWVEKEEKERAA